MTIDTAAAPLLQIDRATVVKNGFRVLNNLSLEITEGRHTAILGPNGSGKSSLIKLITRQYYALARDDGQPIVTIFGKDRWDIFELRSLLGIVSADLHQAFVGDGERAGLEAVISGFFASQGLATHHRVTLAMRDRAHDALAEVGATHLALKPLEQMSTGEARRILIARALVSDPRALLLDEPTTGLDLLARQHFLEIVRQIAQRGKTIILVTHHIEEIVPEIDRVILMQSGRLFADGPKAKLLTSASLSALFGAPVQARKSEGGYYGAEAAASASAA